MVLNIFRFSLCVLLVSSGVSFPTRTCRPSTSSSRLNLFDGIFGGGGSSRIPTSPADRALSSDKQAISAIQAAVAKPKSRNLPLIECEFPPLAALNKLGDGSMRSANQVDDANIAFSKKLLNALGGFVGPKTWIVTSSTASARLVQKASKLPGESHCLRDGLPDVAPSDICVILAPCVSKDYQIAKQLAQSCKAVILVNGFAKDTKSVPQEATMAYFLKPLTYNSQVAGYLVRAYPSDWAAFDATSKQVLKTFSEDQILVRGTLTPDLREPGKLVQKSVDERAIKARQQ